MKTARIGSYQIVEIIKQTAKTSIVKELTQNFATEYRVKNKNLKPDAITPLTLDNAKTAATVLSIAHPEEGVKRFEFDYSGRKHHSKGTGSSSSLLFEGEFKYYRVITFREA